MFESPDLSVADYRFSPDGRSIWFTASDKAADNLYTIPLSGGTPVLVAKGGSISAAHPGADFAVFSNRRSRRQPSSIASPPMAAARRR